MKGLVLAIIIFIIFAVVGYQVAIRIDHLLGNQEIEGIPTDFASQEKEYKLILIHVDRLDRPQPRLVSVWYVSLFFIEANPPTLTLAQMYPTPANPGIHQSFERSFSLNHQGDPTPGFWKDVQTLGVKWEGFLIVDDFSVQKVMEWTNGAGDFPGLLGATQNNPEVSRSVITQSCESLGGIRNRGPAPFKLSDLVPAHFRSNLRMEKALAHWNEITTTELPVQCDVLLAP